MIDIAQATDLYAGRIGDRARGGWATLGALPPISREDLVSERIRTGSPSSGRRLRDADAVLLVQLELAERASLYVGLDRGDLDGYVTALERALQNLGVRPGEVLALYEFGSSPMVYLASHLYVPHGGEGAADRLGCAVVCNDGAANLAERMVEIVKYTHPRHIVLRDDCVEPFLRVWGANGLDLSRWTEALIVTVADGAIRRTRQRALEKRSGLKVPRIARSDTALFIAAECPDCSCLHVPPDLYHVDVVEKGSAAPIRDGRRGTLVVTSLWARGMLSLRMLTRLEGSPVVGSCARGPADIRFLLS